MSERPKPKCRFCGSEVEYFPEPDGSCDYHCPVCTWHEHLPSDDEVVEAKKGRRMDSHTHGVNPS